MAYIGEEEKNSRSVFGSKSALNSGLLFPVPQPATPKMYWNFSHKFLVKILLNTIERTDRQANKLRQIQNFLGGGKFNLNILQFT